MTTTYRPGDKVQMFPAIPGEVTEVIARPGHKYGDLYLVADSTGTVHQQTSGGMNLVESASATVTPLFR